MPPRPMPGDAPRPSPRHVPAALPYGLLALGCAAAGVLKEPAYVLVVTSAAGAKLIGARVLAARTAPGSAATGLPLVPDARFVRAAARAGRPATVAVFGPVLAGTVVLRDRPGAAVAVALALLTLAAPLELPVVVSAVLAAGARRMAYRGAVVRRLSTVESLGATTVICARTTGFLTQRRDTVTAIVADGRVYEVTAGGVRADGGPVALGGDMALDTCLLAGLACNDARTVDERAPIRVSGAPADAALVVSAARLGVAKPPPRVATLPFTPDRQYMASLHRRSRGESGVVYVKGAANRVLYLCRERLDREGARRPLDRDGVLAAARTLGARGLRVLAFARADVPGGFGTLTEEGLPGLVFLGLQALHDPPRPTAADAVHACLGAGVQLKLLTDNDRTAGGAFAGWIGLAGRPVTSGAELASRRARDVPVVAGRAAVFSLMSPADETLLVAALHERGQVVTFVGGGPVARHRADTGVTTLPRSGGADLVIPGGDAAGAVAAVIEGRRALDDVAKVIAAAFAACAVLCAVAAGLLAVGGYAWPVLGALAPGAVLAVASVAAAARDGTWRLVRGAAVRP